MAIDVRRAFTLTETILALTLLSLVMVAILNLFPSSMATIRAAEYRHRAEALAGTVLEQRMAVPFDQQPIGLDLVLPAQVIDQVEYRTRLQVLSADGNPQYLRTLRVTVSWTVRNRLRESTREILVHRLPGQL